MTVVDRHSNLCSTRESRKIFKLTTWSFDAQHKESWSLTTKSKKTSNKKIEISHFAEEKKLWKNSQLITSSEVAARSVRKKDETESNFRVLVALVMILIQFAVIFAKISFALETIANGAGWGRAQKNVARVCGTSPCSPLKWKSWKWGFAKFRFMMILSACAFTRRIPTHFV